MFNRSKPAWLDTQNHERNSTEKKRNFNRIKYSKKEKYFKTKQNKTKREKKEAYLNIENSALITFIIYCCCYWFFILLSFPFFSHSNLKFYFST
jgi:hypothetical protein